VYVYSTKKNQYLYLTIQYLSEGERKTSQRQLRQLFENYFCEKPLAVSISHLLNESPEGMTATELANVLHLSVPTLYRLTLKMHQLKLIKSERKGRKNIFKICTEFKDLLPSLSETLGKLSVNSTTMSDEISKAKFYQVSMVKSILEE
jgi:hypothetical protein